MHGNKLEQLQVGRLNLQKVSMNDTAFAVELFSKPELVAHRPDPDPENSETIRKNLVHAIEHWQTNGFGRWLLSMNDVPVGFGGLTLKRGFEGLNISFHLHPTYWGKGIATEFVQTALQLAFRELAATRIIGLVRKNNASSLAVLKRCGFCFEQTVELGGAPSDLWVRRKEQ